MGGRKWWTNDSITPPINNKFHSGTPQRTTPIQYHQSSSVIFPQLGGCQLLWVKDRRHECLETVGSCS